MACAFRDLQAAGLAMVVRKPRTGKFDAVLGGRVKGLRKARSLSQSALAERLGITFQQVQKYENGSNRISAAMLIRLADALGVKPMDLMADVGREFPDGGDGKDGPSEAEQLLAAFQRIRSAELRDSVLKIVASLADQ
jgi:transcriptional regulator with XRE-family HTH domain